MNPDGFQEECTVVLHQLTHALTHRHKQGVKTCMGGLYIWNKKNILITIKIYYILSG